MLVSLAFGISAGTANAAAGPQCNGIGEGGGKGIICTVEIINNLDNSDPSAPVANSTVTLTACLGDANAAQAGVCTSTGAITYPDLTTAVNQCNYAVNGGGASLVCSVLITNNIIGTGTAVAVSSNQCNRSLDFGDVLACTPYPSTTDPSTATIVECNDSDNGGGSVLDCVVDPASTTSALLPVTVNQCNNSAVGGGSTVTCRVKILTNITAPPPPVVQGPAGGTGGTTGGPVGTTGGTTGSTTTPVGSTSRTGSGSSAGNLAFTGTDPWPLIGTGVLTLLLGGGLTLFAIRRGKTIAR